LIGALDISNVAPQLWSRLTELFELVL